MEDHKNLWRRFAAWWEATPAERSLETFVYDLKNLAIFELLALFANVAIVFSLGAFLLGGEQQRRNTEVFEAWQVITAAHGQTGSGGRIKALELLNSSPGVPGRRRWFGAVWSSEFLNGINLSRAYLTNVQLPKANLQSANLQEANLYSANLQESNLQSANLQKVNLESANLQEAYLVFTNLQEANLYSANLWRANLVSADLRETHLWYANLQEANLSMANLQGADLYDVNLQKTVLLATNLVQAKNLYAKQLQGKSSPLLCGTQLPENITLDPNRDCERLPAILFKRYPEQFTTLDAARVYVDNALERTSQQP